MTRAQFDGYCAAITPAFIQEVNEAFWMFVVNLLPRRGLLEPDAPPDALAQEEPLLAASPPLRSGAPWPPVSGQGAVFVAAWWTHKKAFRAGRSASLDGHPSKSRGFSLHAARHVEAGARERLKWLCQYVMRPPLAAGRMQVVDERQEQLVCRTHPFRSVRPRG